MMKNIEPQINKELISPRIFHIHVDGKSISDEVLVELQTSLKFKLTNFCGNAEGFPLFAPNIHLTLKLYAREEFHESWKKAVSILTKDNFTGYLEGEYVNVDESIDYRDFVDTPPPFRIKRRKLDENRKEFFRKGEFHLTMNLDKSSPKLVQYLYESGLFGVNIEKENGKYVVFSAQIPEGLQLPFRDLIREVKKYICQTGGAHSCTFKTEWILSYKLFNTKVEELPEVIDKIEYMRP